MSTRHYALPLDETRWNTPFGGEIVFNWEYDEGRDRLLRLYEKGKDSQWNASDRIDWSIDVDPTDPGARPDETIAIYGSDVWNRMTPGERSVLRHHQQAWMTSQFLHGEQGALICASKVVGTVPDLDSKFYAATQVVDEARHVEMYSRYLRDKLELAYPINDSLKELLNQVIADDRWDMTYLGMQVMIEGLALAAFGMIRDYTTEPLAKSINAYVMADEARHVAFGNLALRDYYPQLSQAERAEREEFVVEASYLMRDRFNGAEVWDTLGLPAEECQQIVEHSPMMQTFRQLLFSRIVPTIRSIGLWGDRVQEAFADMGVLHFQDLDPDALSAADEAYAHQLDGSASLTSDEQRAVEDLGMDVGRVQEIRQTIDQGRDLDA